MAADYGGGPGVPGSGAAGIATDPLSEATVALQQLGYKPAEAQRMARQAFAESDVAEAIIRKALQSALPVGRASCRERVCQYVWISAVAVSLNTKRHS